MTRGRKPLDRSPEEWERVKKEQRDASKMKTKNVTLDNEAVELLSSYRDELAETLGFSPSLSQAVRHLIKRASHGA